MAESHLKVIEKFGPELFKNVEATRKIIYLIPPGVVGIGDSTTMRQLRIPEALERNKIVKNQVSGIGEKTF